MSRGMEAGGVLKGLNGHRVRFERFKRLKQFDRFFMENADEIQRDLPLPFPELSGDLPMLPAPDGERVRVLPAAGVSRVGSGRVGRVRGHGRGNLPAPGQAEEGERIHARSITLSSNRLGLIAKMDLVEGEGSAVTPVDYKRGKRPHVARGAYDPERIQLCVQGMILREHI